MRVMLDSKLQTFGAMTETCVYIFRNMTNTNIICRELLHLPADGAPPYVGEYHALMAPQAAEQSGLIAGPPVWDLGESSSSIS
jgi:hypothetical protein